MLSDFKKILNTQVQSLDFEFNFTVKRSFRKSISFVVKDGELNVKCPYFISKRGINTLLKKKEEWIKKKIKLQISRIKLKEEKYNRNNLYLFRGTERKVKITLATVDRFQILADKIVISMNKHESETVKQKIVSNFKKIAKITFKDRTDFYLKNMNLNIDKLFIKDYRSKWGLCNKTKKQIFLNWRLIMAPDSVLNYVIIHELCHLIEPNHSKKFWLLVKKYKPNYREDKSWLSNNGFLLFF